MTKNELELLNNELKPFLLQADITGHVWTINFKVRYIEAEEWNADEYISECYGDYYDQEISPGMWGTFFKSYFETHLFEHALQQFVLEHYPDCVINNEYVLPHSFKTLFDGVKECIVSHWYD